MLFVLKQNDESMQEKENNRKEAKPHGGPQREGKFNNGTRNTTFNLSHWATWIVFEYFANNFSPIQAYRNQPKLQT